MSPEQNAVIEMREITETERIVGGVIGSAVGFGIGHGITGQWQEIGWAFSVTEAVTHGALVTGLVLALNRKDGESVSAGSIALMAAGGAAFLGIRAWETVDIWTRPIKHNRRVQQTKAELERKHNSQTQNFHILPSFDSDGGFGLMASLRF